VGFLCPLKSSFRLYIFNIHKLTLYSLRTIDWNPLGTLIATGATDRTLRVWNPDRPNIRYSTELKGHEAPIEKVAFNPIKDTELCSLSNDGVLKVWDVRGKTCVNEIKGLGEAFTLQWHPDGESIIVGNKVCLLSQARLRLGVSWSSRSIKMRLYVFNSTSLSFIIV
jgi:WD40 repeat protein